jgi:hypothetical protein
MVEFKRESFSDDLLAIYEGLKNGYKFSFSKYADGEFAILTGKEITNCDGWHFNPIGDKHEMDILRESFFYSEEGYYVGISCPCCVKKEEVLWMRENVGSPIERVTWANIFVNKNYEIFKRAFIPEFYNHKIVLVANKNAQVKKLPFPVEEHIPITGKAWKDDLWLLSAISQKRYEDRLFLFCAGPLGNMLAAHLWQTNKQNVYLDIGSTLNPWLVGNNRRYLRGVGPTVNKECVW